MRQDINHNEVFARPETVGEDFGLIFEAFADAFRGLSARSRIDSCCSKPHYAAWR